MEQAMARRTIYLPPAVEGLARANARDGESFSATVARLIEQGAGGGNELRPASYTAIGEGPGDLGINAEKYLRESLKDWKD
jgi:hypothetical protein